ncbi:hypothetical protein H6P81_017596 [Aristolochia fimbriata]|uniref:Aminotransferase-like plant mobile domain-containing protein n=1 Tax=Aristolochia fimbriata TaxID=158543 RepID=A0AAV7DZ46_ARIFI|nr:hypothetical protein H6P81_017596 [Aristolochia fimbriata]
MDERLLPYIDDARFGALYRVQWLRLDKLLITSLVERWRGKTNTFHLANGEMIITLEDVAVLLGLRVDEFAVTGSTRGGLDELARVLLGVKLPHGSFQGSQLSRAWIKGKFLFCPNYVPDEVIQQHAQAYLLHCVGSKIFLDRSARGVHMVYMTLFEDIQTAGRLIQLNRVLISAHNKPYTFFHSRFPSLAATIQLQDPVTAVRKAGLKFGRGTPSTHSKNESNLQAPNLK